MDTQPSIGESPRPVSAHERIDLIDVVRGFALFGVLLANLVWVTTDVVLTDARLSQLPTAPLDRIVKPLVVLLVDHKFYTLFSFLIFAAQMAFSRWWLGRYRFGPAEWLWRTLTYGQRQPMRAVREE